MKKILHQSTLSLALATGLIGSAAWSTAAQACAAEPFIGSVCIMATAGSRGLDGFSLAQGQQMPINQYQALYSILGVTWGGNGVTNFNLPNLSGRVVVGSGTFADNFGATVYQAGQTGGARMVALSINNLPAHNHMLTAASVDFSKVTATTTLSGLSASLTGTATLKASAGGTSSNDPTGKALTSTSGTAARIYSDAAPSIAMNAAGIDVSGLSVGNFTGSATTTLSGTVGVSGSTTMTGANAPVAVMPPYLVMNYYIALNGIYPPQP